ncbi:hypothetical protein BD560DRAFT_429051 [Blakeslea trispora]|nr:hypothetical protein BD560DRAFT_429051 [Blakeslea trispora]
MPPPPLIDPATIITSLPSSQAEQVDYSHLPVPPVHENDALSICSSHNDILSLPDEDMDQEDSIKDDESFHSAASDITSELKQVARHTTTGTSTEVPSSHHLEVCNLPPTNIIEISSDSSSTTNEQNSDQFSSSDESVPPPSSSSLSSTTSGVVSPMSISPTSETNEQESFVLLDERIDIADFAHDTDIQEASATSEMEQVDQNDIEEQTNMSPSIPTLPTINIVGSNNQVVLIQGQSQAIALVQSDNQTNPSSSLGLRESNSDVPVEVIDVTPISSAPPPPALSVTYSSPLLLNASPASDVCSPPPPTPSLGLSGSSTVVQRRTSVQEGDNVMETNRHYHSNQISLDFANTEEIPAFLRNWNVNKKRMFKPRLSSSSPAKRQRRTGPDFAP